MSNKIKVVMLSVMELKQRTELFLSLLASVGHGHRCVLFVAEESPTGYV